MAVANCWVPTIPQVQPTATTPFSEQETDYELWTIVYLLRLTTELKIRVLTKKLPALVEWGQMVLTATTSNNLLFYHFFRQHAKATVDELLLDSYGGLNTTELGLDPYFNLLYAIQSLL
jgi:hypothetical protein